MVELYLVTWYSPTHSTRYWSSTVCSPLRYWSGSSCHWSWQVWPWRVRWKRREEGRGGKKQRRISNPWEERKIKLSARRSEKKSIFFPSFFFFFGGRKNNVISRWCQNLTRRDFSYIYIAWWRFFLGGVGGSTYSKPPLYVVKFPRSPTFFFCSTDPRWNSKNFCCNFTVNIRVLLY